eukprot:gene36486-44262_t
MSAISTAAAVGLQLEAKTPIGRSLSSPVCAMLVSSLLTNFAVIPTDATLVPLLQNFVVNLATPLLLLSADLKEIRSRTGSLFKAFLLAILGTVLGSVVAYALCQQSFQSFPALRLEGWKIAGALVAKNIGGGINFMAVANTLGTSSAAIAMGLAVDNIAGLVYFPLVSWLGGRYNANHLLVHDGTHESNEKESSEPNSAVSSATVSSDKLLYALTLSLGIVSISDKLAEMTQLPPILLTTSLSVILATLFAENMKPLVSAGEMLGKLLLLLFFGSVGISAGKIIPILSSPAILPLLAYNLILYTIHLAIVLALGPRAPLRLSLPDLLVGSNAAIGNAATASAFAGSMRWREKVVPAMLVGTLGNVLGTFVGLLVASKLFRVN